MRVRFAKKILFESFKNRFLIEDNNLNYKRINKPSESNDWINFLSELNFKYEGKQVLITWKNQKPEIQQLKVDINDLSFYSRVSKNENLNKTNTSKDITKEKIKYYF